MSSADAQVNAARIGPTPLGDDDEISFLFDRDHESWDGNMYMRMLHELRAKAKINANSVK